MIKRTVFSSLLKHLNEKEITLITGPRQVGKTFLMMLLKKHLKERGELTLYFNLDIEDDASFFESQSKIIQRIKLEFGGKKGFVFIDEIQRKQNAGLFLKGIYDMNLPYKLIVSGSGSLELKEKIHESLAGRKKVFTLNPLSFLEIINYRTGYRYEKKLREFLSLSRNEEISRIFEEYLVFGGYPRVFLADTLEKKESVIKDIYESYIERDIRGFINIEKPDAYTNLLRIIASQIGSLININELSSTIGVSTKTINSYLWYLEKTFIIYKVTPYYRNIRKEITRAPVYYFYDQGMRNYLLGLFGIKSVPYLTGHLFQNIVFNILRTVIAPHSTIHFWRTRDNAEVDFVIDKGFEVLPVEVKYKKLIRPEISRSFYSFISKYKPKTGYLVNLTLDDQIKIGETTVRIIPYYNLFFVFGYPTIVLT